MAFARLNQISIMDTSHKAKMVPMRPQLTSFHSSLSVATWNLLSPRAHCPLTTHLRKWALKRWGFEAPETQKIISSKAPTTIEAAIAGNSIAQNTKPSRVSIVIIEKSSLLNKYTGNQNSTQLFRKYRKIMWKSCKKSEKSGI